MTADRASGPEGIEDLLSHASWLHGLAAALVRDPGAADDLVQDTWLAAMRNPRPHGVAPRAWLTGIARNLARFSLRTGSRRARRERDAASPEALPGGAELVERLETQRRLAALVAELEEPVRSVVLLRFYEGLDSSEIARRRGEPAGTVRWRLKQGLDELRARLDAASGGDRGKWMSALAPLAVPLTAPRGAPHGTVATTAATSGLGGFVMASTSKVVAAGVAVVLLAAAGLWLATDRGDRAPSAAPAAPAAAARPVAEGAPRSVAETKRPRTRPAEEAAAPASVPPETAPPRRADGVRLTGRIVETSGAPIPGASVRVGYGGRAVPTGGDGRFSVAFPMARDADVALLQFAAPGRAMRVVEKPVARGADADLGDVALAAGGTVSGRVVDDAGSGVPNAWIVVTTVPVEDADALRRSPAPATPGAELTFGPEASSMLDLEPCPRGPVVVADANGEFVVAGLPAGTPAVLRAGAQGRRQASAKVTARAEGAVTGVRVVLERLRENEGIEGRVLAPDGTPAAGIEFLVEFDGRAIRGASLARTDDAGRFFLQTLEQTTYSVRVEDTSRGWTSERIGGLLPGRRDVVLAAQTARVAEIVACGPDGAPIVAFAYRVLLDGGPEGVLDARLEPATASRPARVLVPGGAFSVAVEAPGFAKGKVEHVDPAACGERIVVPMKLLPAWCGVVRSASGPVAGAAVSLHRAAPEDGAMFTKGFPLTRETFPDARATTDARGVFELTVREEASYVVRAEAPGFAPAEIPSTRLAATGGELPAIELSGGGAIEGVVTTGGSRSPEGIVVGAARCDGDVHTVTVGADGRFRFERLTPGPWIVKPSEKMPATAPVLVFPKAMPIEWNCEVRAGETTRHDIATGAASPCVVRGRLTVPGDRKWFARIDYTDLDRGATDVKMVEVGADGTFEIATDRTGDYWLTFLTGQLDTRVHVPITLAPGEQRVDLAFAVGSVELTAPGTNATASRYAVWEGEGGVFARAHLVRGDGGRSLAAVVPAGKVRIVRYDPAVKDPDPRKWPTDAEAQVVAGETRAVVVVE